MQNSLKSFSMLVIATAAAFSLSAMPPAFSAKMPPGDGVGPQITHDLDRSSSARPLQQDTDASCVFTPLQIDSEVYQARCLPGKGPCFSHNGEDASLVNTNIVPWLEPLDMTQEIVLADDSAKDFTLRNASNAFQITYLGCDYAKFRYSNYDPNDRCYDVLISRAKVEPECRIWVGESADDRQIDTKNTDETGKRFCAERLTITVKQKQ